MQNQLSVYFPLRSNAWAFQTPELRQRILAQLKLAILLYDVLIFEDGTYTADILESESADFYLPPGFLPPEQRTIDFEKDIKPTEVKLGIAPERTQTFQIIFAGTTKFRFKIDYFDLFRDVDCSKYEFLKFVVLPKERFPQEARSILNQMNDRDRSALRDVDIDSSIRDKCITNLNHDLITSILVHSSVILDERHEVILQHKSLRPLSQPEFSFDKDFSVLTELISLQVPDLESIPLDEVLDLRSENTWCEFRERVCSIASRISSDPELLTSRDALRQVVAAEIGRDMLNEIASLRPKGKDLVLDLAMQGVSLIPGLSIATTLLGVGKTVSSYLENRTGWVAFLQKLEERRT